MRQTFHIDFIKKSKIFFCVSLGIMLVCLILNLFALPTLVDIQFTGGTIIKYSYDGDIKQGDIKKTVNNTLKGIKALKNDKVDMSFSDNMPTKQDPNHKIVTLQFVGNKAVSVDDKAAIEEALQNTFPGLKFTYAGDVKKEDIEKTINKAIADSKTLKKDSASYSYQNSNKETKTITLKLKKNTPVTEDDRNAITSALQTAFPDNQFKDQSKSTFREASSSSVDASKGTNFFLKCLAAVILAAVLMIFYVALRFRKIGGLSAGVMAVVALIHDLIIVYFVFVIFRMPLNDNFIAVLLMILGYSLNDTIVIYDRIRENRRKSSPRTPIGDIVNNSLNQCMVRTICTSITTIIAIGSVLVVSLIFRIDSIVSFALPMMIGLISGSYSSLCIAAPLWVMWKNHQNKKKTVDKLDNGNENKPTVKQPISKKTAKKIAAKKEAAAKNAAKKTAE